jgi:hypothetical protein
MLGLLLEWILQASADIRVFLKHINSFLIHSPEVLWDQLSQGAAPFRQSRAMMLRTHEYNPSSRSRNTIKAFVRPYRYQKPMLYNKPAKRVRNEIYETSWGGFAQARITDCKGEAPVIAVEAFEACILKIFLKSSDVRVKAISNYSCLGEGL